jgi:hypothetical protein
VEKQNAEALEGEWWGGLAFGEVASRKDDDLGDADPIVVTGSQEDGSAAEAETDPCRAGDFGGLLTEEDPCVVAIETAKTGREAVRQLARFVESGGTVKAVGDPGDLTLGQSTIAGSELEEAVVEKIQSFLTEEGFMHSPVDGVFGKNTRSALREYNAVVRTQDAFTKGGRWSGEANEPSGLRFQVELDILPGCAINRPCGTIAVPHVPCRGRITLIASRPGGLEFNVDEFDAASDQRECNSGAGEVFKLRGDGKLDYTATYSGARGVLRRID